MSTRVSSMPAHTGHSCMCNTKPLSISELLPSVRPHHARAASAFAGQQGQRGPRAPGMPEKPRAPSEDVKPGGGCRCPPGPSPSCRGPGSHR